MPIKSIKVSNVMAFQRQWQKNNGDPKEGELKSGDRIHDAFTLEFSDGINVMIGENGTGKTTLLKMIYAATQWSNEKADAGKTDRFYKFFSNNLSDSDLLKNEDHKEGFCYFEVSDGEHSFQYSLSHKAIFNFDNWLGLNISSVMIPTTEMLSHSKGFLALNNKYKMPFDGTQVDIIVNASLPEARSVPEYMQAILDQISDVIDGEVIQEDDTFYVVKRDGRKIDFSLEAEGLRKLALLWKLIRNGLLEKGTVLLWDEPESNLNPELFPLVARILLELQKNGIQIFVATHSYNFAKYLEILRSEKEQVKFHSLYKGTSELPDRLKGTFSDVNHRGDEVYGSSAFSMEELQPNHIMQADEKLLDMVYEDMVGRK
ncbi:MAG: ATP-binding protein [Lachnospiraceae bacterium]|nr:ATP-binding protein [Lachnospiraceae bacterium]